jgi:hypothetical protein
MNDFDKTLDADLDAAMAQSAAIPLRFRPANGKTSESRRAVDQLATATAGLLKVEQELNELLAEITGHPTEERKTAEVLGQPAEGLPMFDRVRQDATALAELAIRMHAKISYARERL